MKFSASEVKSLRPVQEAIVKFFKISTWEEAIDEFKSAVSSEKLLQFAGKDFEQTHEFQKYLQRLKRIRTGEVIETADLIEGKMGAFGLVVFSNSLLDVQQSDLAQLPLYEGAFLTIGEAGEQCENPDDVISTVTRINFCKLTSSNVVLFTMAEGVKNLKEKMLKEGVTLVQHGYFYVPKNLKLQCKVRIYRKPWKPLLLDTGLSQGK